MLHLLLQDAFCLFIVCSIRDLHLITKQSVAVIAWFFWCAQLLVSDVPRTSVLIVILIDLVKRNICDQPHF